MFLYPDPNEVYREYNRRFEKLYLPVNDKPSLIQQLVAALKSWKATFSFYPTQTATGPAV